MTVLCRWGFSGEPTRAFSESNSVQTLQPVSKSCGNFDRAVAVASVKERAGDASGERASDIYMAVPSEKRIFRVTVQSRDGSKEWLWGRLSDTAGIGADHHFKVPVQALPGQQLTGLSLGFVGTDRESGAARAKVGQYRRNAPIYAGKLP